jgi:alpha-galactosidase
MSGSMSVGINLMRADESTLNELREHIAYYKTLRPLLHNTYIYKLTSPYPEKAFIWEYLSRNGDGAVIFLFAHGLNFGEDITNLKPICLDGNAVYSVNEKHISGDTLMKYGLNIQTPRGDYQSMIIEIKKIT